MTFKPRYFYFLIILLFAITACKKSVTPNPGPTPTPIPPTVTQTGPDVYVVGFTLTVNNHLVATYWKNGVATRLTDSSSNSIADAIFINGADIYISGTTGGGSPVATYWKNGVAVKMANGLPSTYASGIAVSGSDVYIAGYIIQPNTYQLATYWKNTAIKTLTSGSETGLANAVAVNGADVYVAGLTTEPNYPAAATYWKNGLETKLTDSTSLSMVNAMTINNNDVYLAGSSAPVNVFNFAIGNSVATLWKNGVAKKLGDTTALSMAYAITTNGTDVYTAGFTEAKGVFNVVYWKNGVTNSLNISGLTSITGNTTAAIAVNGTDVYVTAGYSGYWLNGTFIQLGKNFSAMGIAVVPH